MSASGAHGASSSVQVEPRKPGLRSTRPERYEQGLVARDILCAFVARKRISIRELSAAWKVSPKGVHQKLRGDSPVHMGEVLLLPTEIGLELLDEIRLVMQRRLVG